MNRTGPPSGRIRRSLIIASIAIVSLSATRPDLVTTFNAPALAAGQAGEGNGDRPKGTVWVVNRDLGQLAIFDAATGDLLATRLVGRGAHDICISEQIHKAYITAETDNAVSVVDTDTLAPSRSRSARCRITSNPPTTATPSSSAWRRIR
jgi:DNA-binding beta-propeller fold protein YncE